MRDTNQAKRIICDGCRKPVPTAYLIRRGRKRVLHFCNATCGAKVAPPREKPWKPKRHRFGRDRFAENA